MGPIACLSNLAVHAPYVSGLPPICYGSVSPLPILAPTAPIVTRIVAAEAVLAEAALAAPSCLAFLVALLLPTYSRCLMHLLALGSLPSSLLLAPPTAMVRRKRCGSRGGGTGNYRLSCLPCCSSSSMMFASHFLVICSLLLPSSGKLRAVALRAWIWQHSKFSGCPPSCLLFSICSLWSSLPSLALPPPCTRWRR